MNPNWSPVYSSEASSTKYSSPTSIATRPSQIYVPSTHSADSESLSSSNSSLFNPTLYVERKKFERVVDKLELMEEKYEMLQKQC